MWRRLSSLPINKCDGIKTILKQNHQIFARISTTVTNLDNKNISSEQKLRHVKKMNELQPNMMTLLSTKFKENPYVQLTRMNRPIGKMIAKHLNKLNKLFNLLIF
jgi:thymidine phosphorylase